MSEDRVKILEERLTRLEAALTQRPGGIPGGGIVDPAAFAFQARQIPSPVVDPAPWPYWGGYWPRPHWPTPVVDPGPFPHPVVDPAPWHSPVVDPAVFAQSAATLGGRIGRIADPPPIDFSRFSVSQLESVLHSINAEKARLDSMQQLVQKQLDAAKQKG